MHHDSQVSRSQVEITNAMGFHMRPAGKFAQLASTFADTEIRVHFKGRDFNGKSVLELMTVGAECGTRLEIAASGPAADAALQALSELVEKQFYEGPDGAELTIPSS
jgi:phosphotransferase system HPr (HPr) family protein